MAGRQPQCSTRTISCRARAWCRCLRPVHPAGRSALLGAAAGSAVGRVPHDATDHLWCLTGGSHGPPEQQAVEEFRQFGTPFTGIAGTITEVSGPPGIATPTPGRGLFRFMPVPNSPAGLPDLEVRLLAAEGSVLHTLDLGRGSVRRLERPRLLAVQPRPPRRSEVSVLPRRLRWAPAAGGTVLRDPARRPPTTCPPCG